MPIVLPENPARVMRSTSEVPTTFGERMGAQFAGAFEDNPVPLAMRWSEMASAQRRGAYIAADEARQIAESNGAAIEIPSAGVSTDALEIMIRRAKERQKRQSVIERGPQGMLAAGAGFGVGLGAGLLDPAGFALNFVPVVGNGTRLAMAANSARLATRVGARTAVGAIEGAVGQAIFEPFTGYVYKQEGQEYGLENAATNIAFGAVLGTTAHNLLGGGGDLYRTFKGQAHPWSLPGTTPVPDEAMAPRPAASPLDAQGTVYGGPTKVKVGEGYQPARWAVVDAAEVAPTMEKGDNQFRDRTRAASTEQIQAIARGIDFEYLHAHPDMTAGSPTLSRDGQIIGGNGRAAAIAQAYDLPSGMAYSGPMRERLGEWGIRPEQVQGMKKPMLVRVLEGDVDVRAAAIASNETGTLRMSALEQAKVDGERLGRTDLMAGNDGRLDMAENRGAIRRWVEQFPESERAALMDRSGNLSAEGSMRLRNAALHQAFGDSPLLSRLVDSTDAGLGRVSAALLRASGKIAEVRSAVSRGELHAVDLGDDIVAAVERLAWLREKGMPVDVYLRQGDMLGDGLSPEARRILGFLGENMDSGRRMGDMLVRWYEGLQEAGDPNQGDMFGGSAPPDKAALLERAISETEADRSTAEAKLEAASPETREAAMAVASAHLLEGNQIDVQALVDMDPAIGQAKFEDVVAAARRQESVEASRTADVQADREVEASVAKAPKSWDTADGAKAERERVAADLDMLQKAQADAWKYSRSESFAPSDPATLRAALETSFGGSTDALLKAGNIEVVARVADLPAHPDGIPHPADVAAMTDADGRVYLVAENASPSMARGLLLHEVGVHVGLEPMLGRQGFEDVLAQVDRLLASSDEAAMSARRAVPEDTPAHLVREEALAYLVQHHPELPLVQRIIAAVRAWAYKNFQLARDSMELTTADLQALAVASLRQVAREADVRRAGGSAYARGMDNPPKNVSYRFTAKDSPMSDWGHAMFADNRDAVSGIYGKNEYRVPVEGLTDVRDLDDAIRAAWESRDLGRSMNATDAAYYDDLTPDDIIDQLINVDDIVNTAKGYDSPLVNWLYDAVIEPRGIRGIKTPDGAVVFDPEIIKKANLGPSSDIRYSRSAIPQIDAKAELAPFAEAEARAEKYASAVRAAAARWGSDAEMRAAIQAASGGEIVGREVEDLIESLRVKHREVVTGLRKMSAGAQAADRAVDLQDAALQAADMLAEAEVRAAAVEHRNAMLSLAAKTRILSYVRSQFVGREDEGLRAVIAGTEYLREGGRMSAALAQKQYLGKWMAGLEARLQKEGLWDMFAKDAYAKDVARALWQHSLRTEAPDFSGIHPDAKRIADAIHLYQTDARNTQNQHGAWIGSLEGWMYRQAHDMNRMRKAGAAKWRDYVRTRLDWERIQERLGVEDPARFDREEFLDAAWLDLSNGEHFKPDNIAEIKPSVGPANLAKKVSQARTLHWIDADAAFGYLQEFGPANGSLSETILGGLQSAARSAGLMRVLGPNYEANIQAVADQLQRDLLGTPTGDKWRGKAREVQDLLHHVDGSLSIPHSSLGSKIGSGLRAWQSMAKLGAAVVSQVSDIPVFAANIAHRFDTGILPGVRDAMSGLLQGRPKGERAEILAECGYFHESIAQQVAARWEPGDVPGAMSKAMEQFFKWGGITWWTETLRSAAVLTTSRRLGDVHAKGWDGLAKGTREMLGLYRIDAGRWDILRMGSTREAGGEVFLTPEGLSAVPDAAFRDYLDRSGRPSSDAAVGALRTDLADSMRSMFLDQAEYAVLEPSARTRQVMLRGSQAGTWTGEGLRMFAQFKSFPVVYVQKAFGREIQGRGYDTIGSYLKSGDQKAFGAMLGLMASLLVSGYVAGAAKDLLKLRKPRPLDDWRTWAAAWTQGGGLGIYGDFLFGQASRFGSGPLDVVAGPVPGALAEGLKLGWTARDEVFDITRQYLEDGEVEAPTDLASKAFRYGVNNTPFMNLHILRPALNALLFWRIEEALNPGSLRRSERRLYKETGSRHLISPSELVR
jgi:hypothetical protein